MQSITIEDKVIPYSDIEYFQVEQPEDRIFDNCGTMGLCPKSRVIPNARGCGARYVFSRVKGVTSYDVTLRNGESYPLTEKQYRQQWKGY